MSLSDMRMTSPLRMERMRIDHKQFWLVITGFWTHLKSLPDYMAMKSEQNMIYASLWRIQ